MESWNEDGDFKEMKNTLIHNCIGSHANCFNPFCDSSVTENFEKSLHKYKYH